ncbi:MAG: hypothetical protein JWO31_3406 [Phycisphaerales bacterium]|nr:hypothetical protein [Phycisphaerales bacterium]
MGHDTVAYRCRVMPVDLASVANAGERGERIAELRAGQGIYAA